MLGAGLLVLHNDAFGCASLRLCACYNQVQWWQLLLLRALHAAQLSHRILLAISIGALFTLFWFCWAALVGIFKQGQQHSPALDTSSRSCSECMKELLAFHKLAPAIS